MNTIRRSQAPGKNPCFCSSTTVGAQTSSWSSQRNSAVLHHTFRGHGYPQPRPRIIFLICLARTSFPPPWRWWFSNAVLGGFMYSEGRPITAPWEAHAMPPLRPPESQHFHSQSSFATERPSPGLTWLLRSCQDHAHSQSETDGAYQYASPTHWVIAFSTTGDRMVLQSHSAQPHSLVLKYRRRSSVSAHPN